MLNNSEAVWHLSCDVFGFHEEKHTPVFSLELRPRFLGTAVCCALGVAALGFWVLVFSLLFWFCSVLASLQDRRGESC